MKTTTNNNTALTLTLIFSLMVIGQLSLDIYIPLMPLMTVQFHTSDLLMQLSITLMLATFSCSQLLMGPLVSQYGKKPLMIAALLILTAANVLCALSHSIVFFLIFRLLTGIGAGFCNVLARTELVDSFEGKPFARYSSYLYLSWALVPMIAPVIGGYLGHFTQWATVFYLLAALSLLLSIPVLIFYTQHAFIRQPMRWRTTFANYRVMIEGDHKYFMHLIMCIVLSFATLITLIQCLPFYLDTNYHFNAIKIAQILFIIGLSTVVGIFINLQLLKHLKTHTVIYLGLIVMTASSIIMLCLQSDWPVKFSVYSLIAWFFILRMGVATVLPNCQSLALSLRKDLAPYAGGLLGFTTYIGSVFISYAIAHLPHQSLWPLLATLMLESVMCLVVFLLRPF